LAQRYEIALESLTTRKRIDGLPAAARPARGGDERNALRLDRHRRERRRAKLLNQKADKVFRII
jgi:hypothetical protein